MQTEPQDWPSQAQSDYPDMGTKDQMADSARAEIESAARREIDDAKARLSGAAERVRHEARNAGTTISSLILDELDRRAAEMGTQFKAVAHRLRSEPGSDETEAGSTIATQAADLIEDASARLQGQSVREMGQRLGQYGRDNPALFVMGCLLTGAMVGRMIVATDGAESRTGAYGGTSGGGMSGRGWND